MLTPQAWAVKKQLLFLKKITQKNTFGCFSHLDNNFKTFCFSGKWNCPLTVIPHVHYSNYKTPFLGLKSGVGYFTESFNRAFSATWINISYNGSQQRQLFRSNPMSKHSRKNAFLHQHPLVCFQQTGLLCPGFSIFLKMGLNRLTSVSVPMLDFVVRALSAALKAILWHFVENIYSLPVGVLDEKINTTLMSVQ